MGDRELRLSRGDVLHWVVERRCRALGGRELRLAGDAGRYGEKARSDMEVMEYKKEVDYDYVNVHGGKES